MSRKLTEEEEKIINDYLYEGNGVDIRYIKNLKRDELVIETGEDLERFEDFLEENGIEFNDFMEHFNLEDYDYYEDLVICEDCGELLYISYFGETQGVIQDNSYNWYCDDCINYEYLIDDFTNAPSSCIQVEDTAELEEKLEELGFKLVDCFDFHFGGTSTPEKVVHTYKDEYDYVWVYAYGNMFGSSADLYIRRKNLT